MNTRFKFKAVLLAALLILGAAQTSQAILSAVGPTDPGNGFPLWYQDANSVALVPCFSGALSPNVAPPVAFPDINMTIMCVLAAEPGFASLPVIFPTNFPTEFFYYIADNDKLTSPAALKIARFALEGTFANLPTVPVDGQQTIFTRVRFTIDPDGGGRAQLM